MKVIGLWIWVGFMVWGLTHIWPVLLALGG
jgi:hypothetical protein